ncbi:MAG TPA: pyridoxamine 5'-phosphate oxidase [Gammaproteobacteria bacterium]
MSEREPAEPFELVRRWLDDAASGSRRNPNAMALATVGDDGRPAARMVLLKSVSEEHGYVVFYTNYRSRKGRELERFPWAAGVLYWEELGRQLRLEGRVVKSPEEESDAYFATRPFRSQLNAWISAQSDLLTDSSELERRAIAKARELGGDFSTDAPPPRSVPRPPHWGGYRLWCDRVELWTEGSGRFHTRLRYSRDLSSDPDGRLCGGPWRFERLQP